MSHEENLRVVKRFSQAVNTGQLDALRHLISPEVNEHDPAPGQEPGPEGYINLFAALRQAFPDLVLTMDTMVTDENHVAMAYTITGTQRGTFLGMAATGNAVRARGVQIARFAGGKPVERWGSSDQLGTLQQLGGAGAPPAREREA